jgi:hypothetical protein
MKKSIFKKIEDKFKQLQKDNRLTKEEIEELKGLIRYYGNDEWRKGAKDGFLR